MHDFVVIGGGIVRLSTARALLRRRPSSRLLVLEKEPRKTETYARDSVSRAKAYNR